MSSQYHKPKHMRWRDKVAYLEKKAASERKLHDSAKVEQSAASDTSPPTATVAPRRRSTSDAPGFMFGVAVRGASQTNGNQEFKAGNVMRWRDKVNYLEKESTRRNSISGPHGRPARASGQGESAERPAAIPEVEEIQAAAKPSFSRTFTHHVPHIRHRDKVVALRNGGSNVSKAPAAKKEEEAA